MFASRRGAKVLALEWQLSADGALHRRDRKTASIGVKQRLRGYEERVRGLSARENEHSEAMAARFQTTAIWEVSCRDPGAAPASRLSVPDLRLSC
jgi:hypothetical protein